MSGWGVGQWKRIAAALQLPELWPEVFGDSEESDGECLASTLLCVPEQGPAFSVCLNMGEGGGLHLLNWCGGVLSSAGQWFLDALRTLIFLP